jgi:hypothetical protein
VGDIAIEVCDFEQAPLGIVGKGLPGRVRERIQGAEAAAQGIKVIKLRAILRRDQEFIPTETRCGRG